MDILIWAGAFITLIGFLGILYTLVSAVRGRKAAKTDDELRIMMQRLTPYNLGAFFLSVIGLMTVVIGVILGR